MKYKILVLGGNGFIGDHLIKCCLKKKWRVVSLSKNLPPLKKRLQKVEYLSCDISNHKELKKKIKPNYDYVVNLSGYIDHSNDKKIIKTHYTGCKNLTQIFKTKYPTSFVQIGSGLEYGNLKSPHREDKVVNLNSIKSNYSKAKYLATKHIIKLAKKNNFPGVVVRFYQVYGPGQNTNRLIPFVIKSCKNDEEFPCSSGNQTKDFLYVTDAIDAIIKILESKNCHGEIINVGYGRPIRVKKIILLIRNFVKKGMPQFNKIKLRKDEPPEYYPNIKKAHKIIGWKPKISLTKGIKLTI